MSAVRNCLLLIYSLAFNCYVDELQKLVTTLESNKIVTATDVCYEDEDAHSHSETIIPPSVSSKSSFCLPFCKFSLHNFIMNATFCVVWLKMCITYHLTDTSLLLLLPVYSNPS